MKNKERAAKDDVFVRNGELWMSFEGGDEDTTVRPTRLSRKELARLREVGNEPTGEIPQKRPRRSRSKRPL